MGQSLPTLAPLSSFPSAFSSGPSSLLDPSKDMQLAGQYLCLQGVCSIASWPLVEEHVLSTVMGGQELQGTKVEERHHEQSCALLSFCQLEVPCTLYPRRAPVPGPRPEPQLEPSCQSRYIAAPQAPVQTQGQEAKTGTRSWARTSYPWNRCPFHEAKPQLCVSPQSRPLPACKNTAIGHSRVTCPHFIGHPWGRPCAGFYHL